MKTLRNTLTAILIGLTTSAAAQQVNTLFFLENAPMRHLVNPAFQPVSNGYINFTPLGYMSLWSGNNSITMRDLVFADPNNADKTITPLHPNADKQDFMKCFPTAKTKIGSAPLHDLELTMDLLSFGFRVKEKGYVHINIMQHFESGVTVPKDLYGMLMDGGMKNLDGENHFDLSALGTQAQFYTEIAGGYSHKLNDQWTIGGKLKFLLGTLYLNHSHSETYADLSSNQWRIQDKGTIRAAVPLIQDKVFKEQLDYQTLKDLDFGNLIEKNASDILKNALTPQGYGAGIDFGFTYKPHPQVQISAALLDLGFIYWPKGSKYEMKADTVFNGPFGDLNYSEIKNDDDNGIDGGKIKDKLMDNLEGYADALRSTSRKQGFASMLTTKLNVGVDANFCNNILGVGVLSRTRLYDGRLYEELTFGGSVRPCNWFNFAITYSIMNNGKYTNVGAGLSFMPYDGINMTLAADYIPTHYVKQDGVAIPYHSKGFNLALGFSIVWGTNHKKDADKDGVRDAIDMCLGTPRGVKVDKLGCPIDSDGDGVPDYLDRCAETSEKAYGQIDANGCPIDSDGDGVPDYLDICPGTPEQARGYVDVNGCEMDSDGDGVPDWKDECPNTPAEAAGMVDEKGCELDSDGDGVPDWRDACPNTPEEAWATVDELGCPIDSDGDGVPDYLDQCPNSPADAKGHVDANGCEIDTDGDGVPDWKDECPNAAGPAINKGCPEVKREVRNLLKKAMQGIQFENGKATIKKASFSILDEIAKIFIENSNFIIEVQGHTDNTGKEEVNKRLSQKRAEAVMEYLVKKGVNEKHMSAHGYGSDVPIADNKTKAGRAQNRRVEFQITFEQISYETVYEHADSTLLKQHMDSVNAVPVQQ